MAFRWDPSGCLAGVASGGQPDPSDAYAKLLRRGAVGLYEPAGGGCTWGLFGQSVIKRAALDTDTFSNVIVPEGTPRILPLMADPPEHKHYRKLMQSLFAPSAMRRAEGMARQLASELIEGLMSVDQSDFAVGFAYPFATRVLCAFLVIDENWEIFDRWSAEMERLTGAGTAAPGQGLPVEHLAAISDYLNDVIIGRRKTPGDDPISTIVQARIGDRPLEDQTIQGLVMALILAGRSTTASAIGNIVLRLALNGELQSELRKCPAKIPRAIEESLRLEAPQQEMPRKTLKDIEIGGEHITKGESVFLNWGSANVDPAHWDQAGEFILDRPPQPHMTFGWGIHQCFGAPLARMEIRVAIEELLNRTSAFHCSGIVERNTWPRLSVEALPLQLTRRLS